VDDGEIFADHANVHLILAKLGNTRARADEREELRAVEQRGVGVGAEEVLCEDLVEAFYVRIADGHDIVVVELGQ
jgi:hypothetical protein